MNGYLTALRDYANFNGRARRAEYWSFRLVDGLISIFLIGLAIVVDDRAPSIGPAFTGIYFLYAIGTVLPSWAATVRRLHDTDRSGANLLLALIPLVGGFVLLVLLCLASTRGPNRYGPDPTGYVPPGFPPPGPVPPGFAPPGFPPPAAGAGVPYPGQPYPYPPQPQPFIQSKGKFALRLILAPILLIAVCMFGGPALMDLARDDSGDDKPATPAGTTSAGPRDGASKVRGVATKGSRKSTAPLREIDDLTRVCDGFYYPDAPRYTGLAPHPIVTAKRNRLLFDHWTATPSFQVPDGAWPGAKDAWRPTDPAKVQLVACADQVATGPKVNTCHVDKPPSDVTMKEAVFSVTLYEVATRNRLAQAKVTGDDKECGFIAIFVDENDQAYTEISDQRMWETLKKYVED